MPYPPPITEDHTFEAGMKSDPADELLPRNACRLLLNCRASTSGDGQEGVVTTVMGNELISYSLPSGANKTIGSTADEKNNKFYYAVYNSNGNHLFLIYDELTNEIYPFLQNLTDTNGVDILKFNPNYPILDIDIVIGTANGVDDTLIYWCDRGLNKGRKTNIQKCLDKSSTGYGYDIIEDYITEYKQAPIYGPSISNSLQQGVSGYWTDLTRNSNYLYGQLFKFCYRYVYDDGEISCYSDWSPVALPPNQNYQGMQSITTANNCLAILIATGSKLVVKIEIAMLTTGTQTVNGAAVIGAVLDWQTIAILNKAELFIADNTQYSYQFYNDGSYTSADQNKIAKPMDFMFRAPITRAFVKLAMTHTGGYEGFPPVPINIGIANISQALYLPPDTVNQQNNPSFTVAQISYTTQNVVTFFSGIETRYNPVITITVGADVKKGNVFTLTGSNLGTGSNFGFHIIGFGSTKPGTDNYVFTVVATLEDTAVTIANKFKAFLRGLGRTPSGVPNGGITNEGGTGGDSFFNYSYFGQAGESITKWSATVTPIDYATLNESSAAFVSIQVKKSGSIEQYGVIYWDDDGRVSDAYTDATCVNRIPFLTEAPAGVLQQPIIQLSIYHQPPVWAKYWGLVRTPNETQYIQMLIQQIIDVVSVDVSTTGEYLDLVVGSLPVYNALHPDSVLSYGFQRGDRLRFIRNELTGALITPFYECEVISYQQVTTEDINAEMFVYGTSVVTPSDGTRADYVGKNIIINGTERTIVSLATTHTTDDSYQLDNTINIGTTIPTNPPLTTTPPYYIAANYTFIDRRGIVRIVKPPYPLYDFTASGLQITVEIYTPQVVTTNLDFLLFNFTGLKFEVLNWGTATRSHAGNQQNQDGTSPSTLLSTPAIVITSEGDAYIRYRELPTNFSGTDSNINLTDVQIIVDSVEDPNYCDFYPSSLNNLGRTYPKDDGSGQKFFGNRTRFSNNYITDTHINGLNDFDETDFVDNNDSYGDVQRSIFRDKQLHLLKSDKDTWLPVGENIINTPDGQQIVATSDKLLGPLQYQKYDGGIGANAESLVQTEIALYHACANRGTMVRVGDILPISQRFEYDYAIRNILSSVKKFGLSIFGGHDIQNADVWWNVPRYLPPLFNNPFFPQLWQTFNGTTPVGTPHIVTQPANGTVTYDSGSGNFVVVMNANFVGNDTFTYNYALTAGGFSPTINGCISVVPRVNTKVSYKIDASTKYCTKALISGSYVNDGNEGYTTLDGYYLEDGTLTGFIMPNVQFITEDCIVPTGATITFNITSSPSPSGGSNNDIWYNALVDNLYVKIGGVWTLQLNRLINNFYVSPVQNLTDCPLPSPPPGNFTAYAQYGGKIDSVLDGSGSGVPSGYNPCNLSSGSSLTAVYTSLTAGTYQMVMDGVPAVPGHIYVALIVNGVNADTKPFTGPGTYTLTLGSPASDPTPVQFTLIFV